VGIVIRIAEVAQLVAWVNATRARVQGYDVCTSLLRSHRRSVSYGALMAALGMMTSCVVQ